MNTKRLHPKQLELLDALDEDSPSGVGPMTRAEIEQYLGLDHTTVGRRIQRLRARKLLRIARWERHDSGHKPVYAKANGMRDAPPLPKLTPKERRDRYEAKHKVERSLRRYGHRSRFANANPFAGLLRPA